MSKYSIKDLEKVTGVKAHTIRIWEKRYNIIKPERTDTNIRYYNDNDLKKLMNISLLNRYGFRISSIAKLSDKEIVEKVISATRNIKDPERVIENLIIAMIEYDEQKFDKTLNKAIFEFGFDNTFINSVYPFLEKVGLLWQIGTISPAHEHFISALIRQKLIVAIDSIETNYAKESKKFLLFLHEQERHEISLLFYFYFIKKHNHKIIYLGQSVPFEDLIEVEKIHNPHFMLSTFTNPIHEKDLNNYLEKLGNQFPEQKIFITGIQTDEKDIILPENIKRIPSGKDFKEILQNIDHYYNTFRDS